MASSSRRDGHIVGVKDEERTMLAFIEPDGIIPFTTTEMARTLASLIIKQPYLEEDIQLGQKTKLRDYLASATGNKRVSEEKAQQELKKQPKLDLPFTARLMAYYRAIENKKDHPLIVDPYAEHLAGDLSLYLNEHVRYSEMDYPIVRAYYIEEKLLTPWCNTHEISQIILLGAGLDTRAYRFEPLQTNSHIIFEVDFPNVIDYKEEFLRNEKPLCDLVRLSLDLSKADWTSNLIKSGFSSDIPTFWVSEGFVYYIEREEFASLLKKVAELSSNNSQIFVDILQHSRWFPFSQPFEGEMKDPFSKHIKWGLDIRSLPSFFAKTGWNVSCSFADEHDQGRNVGQKGMIFIHGVRANTLS
ncbi:MAG: class I SAM-dependent methyltransferase [Promethearchaeota archaeon]